MSCRPRVTCKQCRKMDQCMEQRGICTSFEGKFINRCARCHKTFYVVTAREAGQQSWICEECRESKEQEVKEDADYKI